jgi:hypothetical protein
MIVNEKQEAITAEAWLAENGPRTEDEAHAVAWTLVDKRQHTEALQQLDALTRFERILANRAAAEERDHVMAAIERIIGPSAETVNATALRSALRALMPALNFMSEPPNSRYASLRSPGHHAAARVVANAHTSAEEYDRLQQQLRAS